MVNLSKLSTRMIVAIHERLVLESLALTRPKTYAVFACQNLPFMGFLSPGLIWLGSIAFEGRPKGFGGKVNL